MKILLENNFNSRTLFIYIKHNHNKSNIIYNSAVQTRNYNRYIISDMDLREFQHEELPRHPWEISRVKALKKILDKYIYTGKQRVLDLGCGDCFAVTGLFRDTEFHHIDAVDVNLTENQAAEFTRKRGISVYHSYDQLSKKFYDTILALDVIEHVEDAVSFIRKIAGQYAAPGAVMLFTVPAFNRLYSSHDTFLGHFRRYNVKKLNDVLAQSGLKVIESGHLFFSLFIIRIISVSYQRITNTTKTSKGVGAWSHGYMVSKVLETVLALDNIISIFLNGLGLKIPGLTVWALCKKQP